ncbi:hypothetical protein [Aquabacterium sp.]|uniref:hypothetical protein n=1 Tax=Aquabacterium sp. TaxID=1872578 RepID=UPI00378360EF
MPLIARLLLLIAGSSWMFAVAPAHAVGFGSPPANVVLGTGLDISLPVRLDGDEAAELDCVNAQVQFGERRVPAFNLRWAVEPGAVDSERVIRVISLVAVDEPVVSVQVTVGCTTRVSRRFTAFADPPVGGVAAPAVAPAAAVVPAARAPAPVAGAAPSGASATPPGRQRVPRAPRRSTAPSAKAAPPKPATAPAAARVATAGPRLALEAPDPAVMQNAMAAALAEQQASAAQAAQAASAAAADAASAAARVQALEAQVARLQADGQQQREQLQQLRTQAGRNDAAGRWLPWMGAALAISLALAGWLAWRLRRLQREAQSRWWADAAEVLADVRPDPQDPTRKVSGLVLPSEDAAEAAAQRLRAVPAPPDLALDLEGVADRTSAGWEAAHSQPAETALNPVTVEPGWPATSPPPRAVSADELIDLEQQAEFFVVLGQDEAAIDLLVGHLRDSGGTSPLPYLKLLEIYRRRGEREAYDRTRSRFNQRFNAYAPEWDTDMQQGRVLGEYPQVLMRLRRAWPSPIDAMTELQTLLFRTEGGELFELPAYRELLLLYSVARDLHDHFDQPGADVDLLLPLEATGFEPTAPLPQSLEVGEATMVLTPEVRLDGPTQFHAVDLDLGLAPVEPTRRG